MKILLSISLIIINLLVSGQNLIPVNMKSPQSYEFERFGNVPVNLNAGTIDLKIPLFETKISENDGSFSLNLSYNSSGFIPAKKSNFVGLNWFLDFGGAITREINGIADDHYGHAGSDGSLTQGFYVGLKQYKKSNEDIFEKRFDIEPGTPLGTYSFLFDRAAELLPDKFNFNFLGHYGFFYIGNDGKPLIFCNDNNIKIDITNISTQLPVNYISCAPKFSEITITDGKGIIYIFGGNSNALEISYNMGGAYPLETLSRPNYNISSWYLKRVVYPDKKEIVYDYLDYNLDKTGFCRNINSVVQPIDQTFFDLNLYISQENLNSSFQTTHNWGESQTFSYEKKQNYNLVKKVLPEKITFSNNEILFKYKTFSKVANTNYDYDSKKLSEIEFKSFKKTVKNIFLDYYVNTFYFFLDKITIGNEIYSFDYNKKKESLPVPWTSSVDYWGFWNSESVNNILIPEYSFNKQTGDINIIGTSRLPSNTLFDATLLNKIVYPTKGISEFLYENHIYSQKIDKNSQSKFLPVLVNERGYVGGARIRQIIDNDGEKTFKREYFYSKDYKPNAPNITSSGILNSFIRNVQYVNAQTVAGRVESLTESSTNLFQRAFSNSIINYNEVSEVVNNNLSKKYFFSGIDTINDSLNMRRELNPQRIYSDYLPPNLQENIYLKYNNLDHYRGKLIKTIFYKDKLPIKEIENKFIQLRNHANISDYYISSVNKVHPFLYFYKEYLYPLLLSETITRDKRGDSWIESSEKYSYNTDQSINLSEKVISNSDGSSTETSYSYPSSLSNSFLWNKNIINTPLEVQISKNGKMISQTTFNYPKSEPEAQSKTAGYPFVYKIQRKSLANSLVKDDIQFTKYDKNTGNLVEYQQNSLKTSLIWGYGETLPIASLKGVSFSEIQDLDETKEMVLASDRDALEGKDNDEFDLLNKIDNFRKKISKGQVLTYSYDPLIGVRSITNEQGIITNYSYDNSNRLEKIRDRDKNILQEFKYKYGTNRFYSSEKRRVFYKNNCGYNAFGNPYEYVVPANKYSSIISLEDAEDKADLDLQNNGQYQANSKGSCTALDWCSVVNASYISGYSGLYYVDNLNIRLKSSFSSGSNLPWKSSGVKIGTISGVNCRPKATVSYYYYKDNPSNIEWRGELRSNGDIYLYIVNGEIANNKSYEVEFIYPIN